ncbi:atrial natriuretic peptide receptor 1-like [Physella acuta]|uniref:atrial natriuretic peptide receptor 1-like n=1 Tax=Physella acuta TaxID=109671 RepID=UPI0027DCD10D|nr:atrial natriuretic peptide receptor 1-like [Physella acuta]
MTRNNTKSTFSFVLRQSKADMAEASTHDKNVSLYKGNVVKVECLDHKGLYVTSQLLKELQQMRAINHPNLLRFIGLCLEADEKFMVTEHCPKGALAEVVMDETFTLDLVFSLSILNDIVQALMYIHKQPIRVHGRLTSEACLIDSRFSVKVAHYGLPTIYDNTKRHEKDLLWMAPEVLRSGGKATPEADVYSVGIIISEILTRDAPFGQERELYSINEIVSRIKEHLDFPLRPGFQTAPDMGVIGQLMEKCWEEDPTKRLPLLKLSSSLRSLMA